MMGVLNATPDSFYAHSRIPDAQAGLSQAQTMVQERVDVFDIGGESTRPGATTVSLSQELERVLPLIESLNQKYPLTPISIDTQKAEVARLALERGARMVNDISALRHDPEMAAIVADNDCPVVLMHMQGTPETMQKNPHYSDVIDDLKSFFEERLATAQRAGIAEDHIILDPGIGFGKTFEHNLQILKNLGALRRLGRPILIGLSRKSFIGKITGATEPEGRLEGSIATALWAVQEGVDGLRVHDVGATRRAVDTWQALSGRPTW